MISVKRFTLIELLVSTTCQIGVLPLYCLKKIHKNCTSLRPSGSTSRLPQANSSHLHIFTQSAFTLIELLVVIVNLDSYRPEPSDCSFSGNTWPFKTTAGHDPAANTFCDLRHAGKIQNLNADGHVVGRGWQLYSILPYKDDWSWQKR